MNFLDFKRLIRPISNKIFLLLGRAVLKAIENSNGTQRIQVLALADETISDIERFQEYGFESYPFAGAEVFIGFLNGNRDHGIALCIHDSRYRPTDLVEGEVAIYHKDDKSSPFRIHFKAGGTLEIIGTTIKIDGSTVDIGDTTGALEKLLNKLAMIIYNGHTHNDPVAGVTGVPNTLMVEDTDTTIKTKAN
ncbi:MAG: phage baseplate assembly protein [Deltaproteobacteria bacterium]|nr:phage baseplate assembly protein [Deltaproteobacteria bacterium]